MPKIISPPPITETPQGATLMIDIVVVAQLLDCSKRLIFMMVRDGRMPQPIKFGRLNKWPRAVIEQWITDGCPRCDSEVAK